jgi:23S rRNA (adenine-N6)-dimethyltransferase
MPRAGRRRAAAGSPRWSDEHRRRRRKLGQNFLKDGRTAKRIVEESGVGEDDLVLEFGAGSGILTRQLARVARKVVAVECDPFWVRRLEERFSGVANVRAMQADALEVELPTEPFRMVANLPFYITTPILHRLLDDPGVPLQTAHLLVQKPVALKHARSSPTTLKTLAWGPWYGFSAGIRLPPAAFDPEPEVETCLLATERRDPPLVEPHHRHLFRALVRRAFTGRGSTMSRALRPFFTRTQLRRLARDNGFYPGSPPSALAVEQWARVFEFMVRVVPQRRWPPVRRGR